MNGKSNPGFSDSDSEDPQINLDQKKEVIHTDTDEHILSTLYRRHKTIVNYAIKFTLLAAYHAYFIYCIIRHMKYDIPIWSCPKETCVQTTQPFWCDSIAFLIILTVLAWTGVLYGYVLKPLLGKTVTSACEPIIEKISTMLQKKIVQICIYILVVGGLTAFMVVQAIGDSRKFVSLAGYFILIFIGWMGSAYPGRVRWRQVTWGLTIQFIFALIVLKWDFGKDMVACISSKVETFLGFSDIGSDMVYGYLVNGKIFAPDNFNTSTTSEEDGLVDSVRVILTAINESGAVASSGMMFKVLSLIYFLSFFVSMLYYLGVLQFVVLKLGWLLSVTVGSTAAESMNAAANIFLGQTEAPLLIKPFLSIMTKSEIHAIMTGGFATIAGSVLGAYIGMGIDANDLLTASFMAAPTALAVSKLFYPEVEESKTTVKDLKVEKGDDVNVLDAAAKGASAAIMLVLNIAASLIAFKAFIGFLDAVVAWLGNFAGEPELSFQMILGYLFWPLAWILGVRADDCEVVGQLIGMKLLITEFPAFGELGEIKRACEIEGNEDCTLEPRSIMICTFALCGFANFASVGMQIGGLSSMAPDRKSDFAQLVLRAMIAGCWVSFLNACLAGVLA